MRNRELWLYIGVSCGIGLVGSAVGFAIGRQAGLLCLALLVLLGGWGLCFTLWRYRKIRMLSDVLALAAGGGQVPDIRTNREGELSILQNDLYKITSALAGRASHLQQDKKQLAATLGDISHQLKTPLTSLLVLTDLLQDESLPAEKRQEFLQRVQVQLERTSWLVQSLLRISRLDAAVVNFRQDEIPLHRLLSKAAEPLLPLAEQGGVSLSIDCPRGLNWQGDAEWTGEALGNLLKNCIEHAPHGGSVAVRCVDNPLHTLILVEDDGPGFSENDLPRLFERFYRGAGAEGEGVGIGLALAKSILQAQGGDVAAENRPQGGARFVVKLYKARPGG